MGPAVSLGQRHDRWLPGLNTASYHMWLMAWLCNAGHWWRTAAGGTVALLSAGEFDRRMLLLGLA